MSNRDELMEIRPNKLKKKKSAQKRNNICIFNNHVLLFESVTSIFHSQQYNTLSIFHGLENSTIGASVVA